MLLSPAQYQCNNNSLFEGEVIFRENYLNEIINLQLDRSKFIKGRFEDINLDGSIVININGLKQNLYSARIIDDRN